MANSAVEQRPRRVAVHADVVPRRHWGRVVFAVVVVAFVVMIVAGLATNDNIRWSIVGDYLFDRNILRGLWKTLQMTLLGTVLSISMAIVIAVMRVSESRIVSRTAAAYAFVFRGVPLIVLLILIGNLGLFFRNVTIGVPFTDISLWSRPVKEVMTPFRASVVGLALAGSGYMSEIMRSGLLAVGRGQREAASSIGLTSAKTLRHVVLPQALRVIVPPMGNELISMLKASAVVSVIAGGDLLTVALNISGTNFRTIEMLMVATIWYLIVIVALSIGQLVVERRVAER